MPKADAHSAGQTTGSWGTARPATPPATIVTVPNTT